jgi:ubiquitin-conjugating enzyme E2 Q
MGQRSSQPAATTGAPSQVTSSPATAPIVPGASPDKRNKLLGRKRGRDSSAIPTTSSSSVPVAKPIQATRPASYFAQSLVDEQADDEPVAALPTPDPTTVTTAETTPFPDQRQEISPDEFLPDSQSLPSYATSAATKVLQRQLKQIIKIQLSTTSGNERYWTLDLSKLDDLYSWYFSLTTFDPDIPLSQDMRRLGVSSIQMQVLFGPQHPHTPPFVRIIKPRFKQWMHGGGGHV